MENNKKGGLPVYLLLNYKELPHLNDVGGPTYLDRLFKNPLDHREEDKDNSNEEGEQNDQDYIK